MPVRISEEFWDALLENFTQGIIIISDESLNEEDTLSGWYSYITVDRSKPLNAALVKHCLLLLEAFFNLEVTIVTDEEANEYQFQIRKYE